MQNRDAIIKHASYTAIFGNLFLAIIKIVAGVMFHSYAVIGDAIDTITDVLMSLIVLYTSRIIKKPADSKYVYGYSKAEAVATKALSFFIFFAGCQLFLVGVKGFFSEEQSIINPYPLIIVTVISIVGKLLLSMVLFKMGKKANSSMINATAKNMKSDVLISVSVLVGLLSTLYFQKPIIDVILAIGLSVYIIKSAFEIFMDSNLELMDATTNLDIYDSLFQIIYTFEGVENPHRARVRKIASQYQIDFDVEMSGDLSLHEVHDKLEELEEQIRISIDNIYDIRIHAEPFGNVDHEEKFGISQTDFYKKL